MLGKYTCKDLQCVNLHSFDSTRLIYQVLLVYEFLVTHQHQFIGDARCLLMKDGKLEVDGNFTECVAASGGHIDFVSHNEGDKSDSDKDATDEDKEKPDQTKVQKDDRRVVNVEKNDSKTSSANKQEEKKSIGIVSKATFFLYARSMGGWFVAAWLLLLFLVSQAASLVSIAMIGRWSERTLDRQVSHSSLSIWSLQRITHDMFRFQC